MNIKLFSPLHMLIQLVLLAVLLGGNYLYVNWFIKKAEPRAKAATEQWLGVGIERNFSGSWTVPANNTIDYKGSKLLLHLEVFAINLVVMLVFVGGFLIQIVLLFFLMGWLFKGTT